MTGVHLTAGAGFFRFFGEQVTDIAIAGNMMFVSACCVGCFENE